MNERAKVVYQKIEHARWRLPAHKGKLTCLHIRTITSAEGKPQNRIYSGGDDGTIKVWDGKDGRILMKINGASSSPISCISFAHSCIFIANGHGEIIRLDANGKPQRKWKAHSRKITCFQIVNQKRVFSGSLDCSVKLFSEDSEILRQFPSNPSDCEEGILQLQVIPGNLIFTASDAGVIRVYNMRQQLLKVLRTSSLEGVPIRSMHIQTTNKKISVFIGNNTRLTTWYLTSQEDEHKEISIRVDAVKALEGRVPLGYITALKSVFVNPLKTKEPTVFLASSCGDIFLYIPTTKIQAASQGGAFVEAQKFKSYTFKDAHSSICCLAYGGSRLYAGSSTGNLLMWKEPYNMTRLLSVCSVQNDEHPYVNINHTTPKKIISASKHCHNDTTTGDYTSFAQQRNQEQLSKKSCKITTEALFDLDIPVTEEIQTGNLMTQNITSTSGVMSLLDTSLSDLSITMPNLDRLAITPISYNCLDSIAPNSDTIIRGNCCICMVNSKNSALYQCGHACVCFECGTKLVVVGGVCPVCFAKVADCLKFYQ